MTEPVHACARCATHLEWGDLRCSICGLAVPAGPSLASTRPTATVLRCTECGAAVAYSAEVSAPRCAFCAAVMRVEQPVDPIEQADHIVPFEVTPENASRCLRRWLGALGFFRPKDLASEAAIESMKPLFWAGWIVNASALVSYAADSDAGSRRSRWAPHAGQVELGFENLLIAASRGLTLRETTTLAPYYDLAKAARDPRGPSGASVEQFDAQRSAARRAISSAIEATAAARLTQGIIPGSSFRNLKVAVVLHEFTTRRVALPAYVLAYRYRGKLYRALVHGQDARMTFGDAPYSVIKIVLTIVLVASAVALGIWVIIALGARR